jgi:hypothetical protein
MLGRVKSIPASLGNILEVAVVGYSVVGLEKWIRCKWVKDRNSRGGEPEQGLRNLPAWRIP